MSGYRKNTHEVTDSYGNTMTLKDGLRVKLDKMGPDPNPVPDGMEGTISSIYGKCADDMGQIFIKWDNGRTLALDPKVDKFAFLPNTEDQIDLISHLGESEGPITKNYKTQLKQAINTTKPKFKIKTETKKVKKTEKEEELEETMTAGGGGGLAGAAGYSYNAPLSYKTPKVKESVVIKLKDLMNEETTTYNTDYTTGTDAKIWADKNKDGWYWNDKPLWDGGEIVDLLAKIPTVWDDENLDISKEWDREQEKVKKGGLTEVERKSIHTKKWDRCVKAVEKRNKENNTNYKPEAVCTSSIGYEGSIKKTHRRKKEEIEETTTFGSVWGVNGPPVGPAFVAKKGHHIPSKKPIWKGGKIIQKVENDGFLSESKNDLFTEINKVKFVPTGGKYVKIKDKCAKYNNQPWCSQGAIDDPLEISEKTFENIKNISEKTGLSEEYILNKIMTKLSQQ